MTVKIFVPGHTVVRHPDGMFAPSGLYQEIVYTDPPRAFPFRRTGLASAESEPDGPTSYLGGGTCVVDAAATLYRAVADSGRAVSLCMIGGRSDYLVAVAPDREDLTEAVVMRDHAARILPPGVHIEAVGHTRTTEDDIQAVLEDVDRHGIARAFVVMMAFRLARAEAILQRAVIGWPEAEVSAERIVFVPAEALLPDVAAYLRLNGSAAHSRTMTNERFGIRKMLLGQSATTGGRT